MVHSAYSVVTQVAYLVGHVTNLQTVFPERPIRLSHDDIGAMAVCTVEQLSVAPPDGAVEHLQAQKRAHREPPLEQLLKSLLLAIHF